MRRLNQSGATLVELLLSLALIGLFAPLLAASIYQLTTFTEKSQSRTQLLRNVNNAGYWFTSDVHRATGSNLINGAPAVNSVTLNWTEGSQSRSSIYLVSGSNLIRQYGGETRIIATDISGVSFSLSNGVVTFTLSLTSTDRWQINIQKAYEASFRYTG